MSIDHKALVGKLNPTCREALAEASSLCIGSAQHTVEFEHWLLRVLDRSNSDISAICARFGIAEQRLKADLTRATDRMKRGATRAPMLAKQLIDAMRGAYLMAEGAGEREIRSGHMLLAALGEPEIERLLTASSPELEKIKIAALESEFNRITERSSETMTATQAASQSPRSADGPTPVAGSPEALKRFTIDLTAEAEEDKIPPIVGRDKEIRQCIDVLTRYRQNNPILVGEAGVGKTAIAEGLARRIIDGNVPDTLKGARLLSLDLGLLQAGASVRGEFENRLRSVIQAVQASPTPIVLFIDEAHMLIGAGGGEGQGDAANLLKPALARGELRTLAATTWAEYKKYFEKDAALTRRFQLVKIEEPTDDAAVEMLRSISRSFEKHHGVRILEDALISAVQLSKRYISGRQLPEKAVSVMDTACARVSLSRSTIPEALESAESRVRSLEAELAALRAEGDLGQDHAERITVISAKRDEAASEAASLRQRWEAQIEAVSRIEDIRRRISQERAGASAETSGAPGDSGEIRRSLEEFRDVQGEHALTHVDVDKDVVADVIAGWTGIPVGRMMSDELQSVLRLRETMEQSIIGQSHALETISKAIKTSRAGLTNPARPIGVFLLVGTSGVGKTETAMVLADQLYGGQQNVTVINMSEFKEEHKVSLLMGSPPGYVGYGEGGVLTEAVRRKPYSLLLLDEIEKAHPGVQDVFYQVFDKGSMRDGQGRDIDFKNSVIIMTSNAASDVVDRLCADPDSRPEPARLVELLYPELLRTFKPAFLGRVTIIVYYPLDRDSLRSIVALKLRSIEKRMRAQYNAETTFKPAVLDAIIERCRERESGARAIDNIIANTLLPELSTELLSRLGAETPVSRVSIGLAGGGGFEYEIT